MKWAHITTFDDKQYKPEKYQPNQKYKKQIKIQHPSNGKEYRAETKKLVSPWIPHCRKITKNPENGYRKVPFPCVLLPGKLGLRLFKYHMEKILGVKSRSQVVELQTLKHT